MKLHYMLVAAMLMVHPFLTAHAQTGTDLMKVEKSSGNENAAHKATGVVKRVDRAKGTVALAHDPVASLKWPAMTMSFTVKNPSLFDKLPAERKVEFEFVQQGRDYVITSVK